MTRLAIALSVGLAITLTALIFVLARYPRAVAAGGRGSAPVPPGRTLSVQNECLIGSRILVVHVAFTARYTEPRRFESHDFYQFVCDLDTKRCLAVRMDLDGVDEGRPLDSFQVDVFDEATLASLTGSVATIDWKPLRTFVIDLQVGKVTYVESGEGLISGHTEGRGDAPCKVGDSRN